MCNESQRAEVNKIIVERLGQSNPDQKKHAKLEKLARKAKKLAEKAAKAAKKLMKLTEKAEKDALKLEKEKVEKMAALQQQQSVYSPPCPAPQVDTRVYDFEQ